MNQPPPHATYKKTLVNTFVINQDSASASSSCVEHRIQCWRDFLQNGLIERSKNANDSLDLPETVRNGRISSTNSNQSETSLIRHASNLVLTYLPQVQVGPMRVSLKLDPQQVPSFCGLSSSSSSSNNTNSVPLVSLTAKMHELCLFEMDRRNANRAAAMTISASSLIDVPGVVVRAIKCLQYAHMSKLVHGRVCSDAFFISAFENPWIPTLCLGELPLVPQFFVNMGADLGSNSSEISGNNNNSNSSNVNQHMAKSAVNQPQVSSWWKVLAPEILRKEPYDASADVWGIGVLTVQLCMAACSTTGATPIPPSMANLETKDLRDATLVSPILRGLPPAAVSFATMCLKANPSTRPTLAALLNHPWLKMMTKPEEQQQELSSENKTTSTKAIAKEESKQSSSSSLSSAEPFSLPSNSAFKGDLDPKKVNEVLAALEKMKQQREVVAAAAKRKVDARKDDESESSGEDDEDDNNSLENDDNDSSSSNEQQEKSDEDESESEDD